MTIEKQLFNWNECELEDYQCMIFYDPILKVQIGKHPVGTKFDNAVILWDEGKLQFQNLDSEIDGMCEPNYTAEYNLKLSVDGVVSE